MKSSVAPFFPGIFKGIGLSLSAFFVFFLLVNLFYTYSDSLTQPAAVKILLGLYFFSIFIGSFFAGRASLNLGWLQGLVVGFIFALVILIIGLRTVETALTSSILFRFCLTAATGVLGGILGVNIKSSK